MMDWGDHVAEIMKKLETVAIAEYERALHRYLERRLIAEGARLHAQIAECVVKLPKSARGKFA